MDTAYALPGYNRYWVRVGPPARKIENPIRFKKRNRKPYRVNKNALSDSDCIKQGYGIKPAMNTADELKTSEILMVMDEEIGRRGHNLARFCAECCAPIQHGRCVYCG